MRAKCGMMLIDRKNTNKLMPMLGVAVKARAAACEMVWKKAMLCKERKVTSEKKY